MICFGITKYNQTIFLKLNYKVFHYIILYDSKILLYHNNLKTFYMNLKLFIEPKQALEFSEPLNITGNVSGCKE